MVYLTKAQGPPCGAIDCIRTAELICGINCLGEQETFRNSCMMFVRNCFLKEAYIPGSESINWLFDILVTFSMFTVFVEFHKGPCKNCECPVVPDVVVPTIPTTPER